MTNTTKQFLYRIGLDFDDIFYLFPKEEKLFKSFLTYRRFGYEQTLRARTELISEWENAITRFLSAPARMSKILLFAKDRRRKPRHISEYLAGYDNHLKYPVVRTYIDRNEYPFDADGSLIDFIKVAEQKQQRASR